MRTCTVFVYHRVATPREDPYRLAVTSEDFRAQLDIIRRAFVPSRLEDIGRASTRPRAVVTFDDGYADNLEAAAPIAAEMGVPILVYVSSGLLGCAQGFWWDRLAAICARAGFGARPGPGRVEVEIEVAGRKVTIRPDGADWPVRLRGALHARLRRQQRTVIEAALDRLAAQLDVDPAGGPDAAVLSVSGLRELSRLDHVDVGAHTADHELLAALPAAEQELQVKRSLVDLEEITGRRVRHFAYPFGGIDSFDRESVSAVKRLGLETAVTTVAGRVHRLTPRHRLPRYVVLPGTDPDAALAPALVGAGRSRVPEW